MAVYTHLSDAELADILAAYGLGRALAFKGIAEGVSNSNFLLDTERGRFFLTIFERRYNEADLPFFLRVMERLAEQEFPAPRPIRTLREGFIVRAQGKPAIIVSFLEGVSPHQPSLAQCAAIGAALARLHRALEGLELTRANALGPASWRALIAPRFALADFLRPGLAALLETDIAALADWPCDLPRGIIHADLFPDNALFLGETVTGVIDFYFACEDFLAYDLAVCLNAWCFNFEGAFEREKGAALIAAYESVRALSEAERTALPILARGAALRFFATRLADWTDTPDGALLKPKNPLDYADRLAFHRNADGIEAYGA